MAEKETYEALPAGRSLEELIEAERANLMQVQGMARVLYDVLLYSDDDDGTMHADVAHVIARLIAETVDALEKIVRRFKAGEFGPPPNEPADDADSGRST
ncbi:hypothetical protein JM946_28040 [Steroidobacter sp. S1-65]|uniref:Uncharacterized protein n=1 Tax=Steroidobacter gossypii TaxID=2805490 RepID=A0ABS1X5T9_9GAMM|nr:hypothetical protein [Steroidobacter gossypii]MBM0108601.1 hypothetical protein [Steroidobacter gossypii]